MENTGPGLSAGKQVGGTLAEGQTVGAAREKWLELMFYLSVFFGLLHFAALNAQVYGMILHTVFHREPGFTVESSMMMAHLYLAFLAAYVVPKEWLRWRSRGDDEMLSPAESRKLSRGFWIVAGWAVYTGIIALFREFHLIGAVPETLWYTLGEVVGIFCGTEASKYLRTRQVVQKQQDNAIRENYADRVADYCRGHGSIDRPECQNEFGLSKDQAHRLLKRLVREKKLVEIGSTKGRSYKLP